MPFTNISEKTAFNSQPHLKDINDNYKYEPYRIV